MQYANEPVKLYTMFYHKPFSMTRWKMIEDIQKSHPDKAFYEIKRIK